MMQITAPSFDESEIHELRRCLQSGWVTQGPLTERFEQLIADKHHVKYALACTSCTAALHLATLALRLGPGDEVIVPLRRICRREAGVRRCRSFDIQYRSGRAGIGDHSPHQGDRRCSSIRARSPHG